MPQQSLPKVVTTFLIAAFTQGLFRFSAAQTRSSTMRASVPKLVHLFEGLRPPLLKAESSHDCTSIGLAGACRTQSVRSKIEPGTGIRYRDRADCHCRLLRAHRLDDDKPVQRPGSGPQVPAELVCKQFDLFHGLRVLGNNRQRAGLQKRGQCLVRAELKGQVPEGGLVCHPEPLEPHVQAWTEQQGEVWLGCHHREEVVRFMRQIEFCGTKVEEDIVRECKELPVRAARRWGLPLAQNIQAQQLFERLRAAAFQRLRPAGAQASIRHHVGEAKTQHLFAAVAIGNDRDSPLPVRIKKPNLIAQRRKLCRFHPAVQQLCREAQVEWNAEELEGISVCALFQCLRGAEPEQISSSSSRENTGTLTWVTS